MKNSRKSAARGSRGRVGGVAAATAANERQPGLQDDPGPDARPRRGGLDVRRSSRSATRSRTATCSSRSRTGSRSPDQEQEQLDLYVNHETSTRPVPVHVHRRRPEANSQNDFNNSLVSQLEVDRNTAGILSGGARDRERRELPALLLELPRRRGEQGFDRPLLFTNEEGIDWVKRDGHRVPRRRSARPTHARSASSSPSTEERQAMPIWGMGRHNHENSVAVPGYGHPVVLSGDDSFVNVPAQSQLYSTSPTTRRRSGTTRATSGRSSPTRRRQRLLRLRAQLEPAA